MIERLRDPDFRSALPYAAVGFAQGVWNYYIKPELPRPSTIAWGCLAAGVAIYDIKAPAGETMSEGFADANRALQIGATVVTAAHLLRLRGILPEQVDPFSQFLKRVKS